jgi:acetyl esterase/lipase
MTTRTPELSPTLPPGGFATSIGRLCCLIATLLVAGCSTYGPQRPGEKVYRDVLFAAPGGHKLYMDLYVPTTAKPAPVVLWSFGGKGYHVNVRDLTSAGIAVASIQYRMSRHAVYPAQLEDCRAAVKWLHDNGAQYGIDPSRMGASGESSGGQLASLLAVTEGKSRIRAVCALYPATDLVELASHYAKPGRLNCIEKLLGGPIENKLALAAEASPIDRVSPNLPPFLIIHGEGDRAIPVQQSEKFFEALQHAGVPSKLIEVHGKRHWFRLDNEQFAEVSSFFQRFLTK